MQNVVVQLAVVSALIVVASAQKRYHEACVKTEDCAKPFTCLSSLCDCKVDRIISSDHRICLPGVSYGERCRETAQCLLKLNDTYCSERDECQCAPGWGYSTTDNSCSTITDSAVAYGDRCILKKQCKSGILCHGDICECGSGLKWGHTTENCIPEAGARLQEQCKYDVDCITDLTYCKNQVECACKTGYEPLESLNGCRAVEGAECTRDTDCTDLGNFANSHCLEKTCTCKDGYVTNPGGNRCLAKPVRLTDSCEETLQCTQSFGYSSFCNSSKQCECTAGNHFAYDDNNNNNNNAYGGSNTYSSFGNGYSTYGSGYPNTVNNPVGKCVPSVSLRGSCRNSNECYVNSLNNARVVTCKDQTCQCIDGYQQQDNGCVPAKSSHLASSSLLSLLLMMILAKVFT